MANEDARYPFNSGKAENSISLQNRRSNSKIIIKNASDENNPENIRQRGNQSCPFRTLR